MKTAILRIYELLQTQKAISLKKAFLTELSIFASIALIFVGIIMAIWSLVGLLVFCSLIFPTRATLHTLMAFAWLFEMLAVPTVIIGGVASIICGLDCLLARHNLAVGAILLVLGASAIVIRAYTIGM